MRLLASISLVSLNLCIQHDPPTYIVELLLLTSPESLTHFDSFHRTPLHIAVGTGANLSVVRLLAYAHPAACSVRDVDGKTPLILACDSGSCGKLYENDFRDETTWESPSIALVWTLIHAYPLSITLEDDDETNALEHAIISGASIEVVEVIQHATEFLMERGAKRV
jgi:ankyrin repeat protein